MKKILCLLATVIALTSLATEAQAASASARKKEKSATYATLKPWQKRYVDTGVVALTFNADMVYMAVGNPSEKKPVTDGEIWIYKNYYPSEGAEKVKYSLNTEKASDNNVIGGMLRETTVLSGGALSTTAQQRGTASSNAAGRTGGPQGGSMEPADMKSYTFYVAFQNGAVSQMRLTPN